MPALRIAHFDGRDREVLAPAVGHPAAMSSRQLTSAGIPRLHPRIDDDRRLVRDVIAHDPAAGGVDVGRRLEARERRPQESS